MQKVIFTAFIFIFLSSYSSKSLAEEKTLKWGGDASGGVPFVMVDPQDLNKVVGIEVEVAELIIKKLGMKPEFVQNQWDGLIPGLVAGNYDLVINSVEITEDRRREIDFSDPYFLTYEQLTVRKDQFDISSLGDLKGKKVGTISAAYAERMLDAVGGIDVKGYDSHNTLYDDLTNGRLDAVLLDQPVALYYAGYNQRLKNLEKSFGEIAFGIGVRKGDKELLNKINLAIKEVIESGELRHIYERWGVWNAVMASQFRDHSAVYFEPVAYDAYLKFMGQDRGSWKNKMIQYGKFIPPLARGAVTTLQISVVSMLLAMLFGLLIALIRLHAPKPIATLTMLYVEFVRGTPLLIQLFFIYYGLPTLGIMIEPMTAAIMGLALNYSAYESEVYRAGIESIPKGQSEAAFALGMTQLQNLRHIVLPQAMHVVLPMTTNDFISLLKDSSLVSVITMVELTRVYGKLASTYYDYLGIGLMTALIYLLIGLPFVRLSRYAEKRLMSKQRNSKRAFASSKKNLQITA